MLTFDVLPIGVSVFKSFAADLAIIFRRFAVVLLEKELYITKVAPLISISILADVHVPI